ncbi:MAG: hypothetical protein WBX81_10325 [Nitrososphaeraceae archaeon]
MSNISSNTSGKHHNIKVSTYHFVTMMIERQIVSSNRNSNKPELPVIPHIYHIINYFLLKMACIKLEYSIKRNI